MHQPALWRFTPLLLFAVVIAIAPQLSGADQGGGMTTLHSFPGFQRDGKEPYSQHLATDGSDFFGMTRRGGYFSAGVIFAIATDGTDYRVLHNFHFGAKNGRFPFGSLILDGNRLYGMTTGGGRYSKGVVFRIRTDGSRFSVLHTFEGGGMDGRVPYGTPILDGSILYGMTHVGGRWDCGLIFSVDKKTRDYRVIHHFEGRPVGGCRPMDSVVLDGLTLYGTTLGGGGSNSGVLFSIGTDGSNRRILHHFQKYSGDGTYPTGTPVLDGLTLYGMTRKGGQFDRGTVFSVKTDGSEYSLLHEFAGGVGDGWFPRGSLSLVGSTLYGMTYWGGEANKGVLFSIATDGTNFILLHEFAGNPTEGGSPVYGAPLIIGSSIYGMTQYGGPDYHGVLFRFDPREWPAPVSGPQVAE